MKKEAGIDESKKKKKKKKTHPAPVASTARPFPTIIQINRTPRH